jgi:hypothetical protein
MEDGPVVGTAWAAKAVRDFAPPAMAGEAAGSLRRAREWLGAQTPRTLNDSVFQLLGLAWCGESGPALAPRLAALVALQRPDGGWAQLPTLASDAWATGTALYALAEAGLRTDQVVYLRGVDYLLRTQAEDGSWWVASRAWPFQPHFNGRFPYGKDQWISAGATAWASIALLRTLPPAPAGPALPTGQELVQAFRRLPAATRERPAVADAEAGDPAMFSARVKPLLERSCIGCHSGKRPRGNLNLTSREGVMTGGQSGEPAILPGYADDSPMIHYTLGEVEDLEMPPLNRRQKYPALSADEVAVLRGWINAGAPWPTGMVLARPASAPQAVESKPREGATP